MKRNLIILTVVATMLTSVSPSEPAVLEVVPPGGVGALGNVYTTIQAAIDDADPGDTITVAPGTYTEDLQISTENLTLESSGGSAVTTIQLVDGVGIDIIAGADNFVLGGGATNGFTIPGGASTTFVIQLANAPSGVVISHNAIDSTGNASMGVSIGAAGAADLTISNNDFTANSGDGCIWGPRLVNWTVSDNTFEGGSYAVQASGVTAASPSVISGNVITGFTGSGGIVISNGEATSDLTISDNTITGCSNGIYLVQYTAQGTPGDMTTVTIEDNTLLTNDKGIRIGDGPNILASNFTIQNNCFSGNTTYGLQNQHTTELVTAEENAWGNATGPYHPATNTGGLGDEVSDNVDYYPWYPDCTFTTPVYKPVHNVTLDAYYDTIQAALDEASSSDVIEVDSGTYDESPNIALSVTLRSVSGRDVTNIVLQSGTNYLGSLTINASDVVVQGFTITGYDAIDSGLACSNIYITGGKSNIEVTECKILVGKIGPGSNGDDGFGILTTYSPSNVGDNLNVHDNIIEPVDTEGARAFFINPGIDNFTFSDNVVDGNFVRTSITQAMNGTVENNTFTGSGSSAGLGTWGYPDPSIWGHTDFVGNIITQTATAIALYDTEDVLVEDNTISSNSNGLRVLETGYTSPIDASTIIIKCNSINGNSVFGVENTAAAGTVDAERNWWGDVNGPGGAGGGGGGGDDVSTNVDFFPWLLSENDCNDITEVVADYVVDDDWVGLPNWATVDVDGIDFYIGLNAFATIQDAVDAATDGSSIKVLSGTYQEDFTIDTNNLDIFAGGTTIKGVATEPWSSWPYAVPNIDIQADGVKIHGFDIESPNVPDGRYSTGMVINGTDVEIYDNNFISIGDGDGGCVVIQTYRDDVLGYNSDISGLNIHDNDFSGTPDVYVGVFINHTLEGTGTVTIQNNIFEGNVYQGVVTERDYTDIIGNYIETSLDYDGYGIIVMDWGLRMQRYVNITCNTITGDPNGFAFGILIGDSGELQKVRYIDIENNTITLNKVGIRIRGHRSTERYVSINYNSIFGNDANGVENIDTFEVDAERNWWGDNSGPSGAGPGSGDGITTLVDYDPWLTKPVSVSLCPSPCPQGDLDGDCDCDFLDFAIFADGWLEGTGP